VSESDNYFRGAKIDVNKIVTVLSFVNETDVEMYLNY